MEIDRIYNEPCEQTLKQVPNGFIDLTVTSPPYDEIRKYNGFSFDIETISTELLRATKNGGVCVWVTADQTKNGSETGSSFRQALNFIEIGWNLHDTMIYEKDSISFPETNRYSQVFEYMFIFSKGKPKTANIIKDRRNLWYGKKKIKGRERQMNGDLVQKRKGNELKEYGSRYNIWRIPAGYGKSTTDKKAFEHPAIFPERLAADHIKTWSNQGDLVYDPFSGSATTAKMAWHLNRHFLGSEISKEYWKIGNERIKPYLDQLSVFRSV